MALIRTQHVHLGARLTDVSLTLAPGEMLGVIGPNGAGKSSLLQCLAGLLPCQGEVLLAGQPLAAMPARHRAQQLGYLPQACDSAWSLSVADIVALGRLPWGDQDREAMERAMTQAGVLALQGRKVDHLSGGEQARVWLARVLAGQPRVLLADEPIASLDLYHQRRVMDVLRRYAHAERAVVLALHDLSLAARYCDQLCLLDQGRVRALGTPAEVLTEANLSAVFRVPVHVDLSASPPVIIVR
ncbi:MAG: ABC transporter ATP-binding protein [Burkholderiaceae bacterium]|jgi:ABC-type cobalamin/Fe3+-siderophores transport system ATPase subunit|nr:MAG: ABC transporter ATP-binding protein [Burkholderiaceae bacterium]